MPLLDVSHLSKTELVSELDDVIQQIKKAEEDPAVILYNDLKEQAIALTEVLKKFAMEDGAFQTRYIAFQRVEKSAVQWKAVCEHLYRTERINDADVLPFKKDTVEIRAMKIKEGKGDLDVQS